MEKLKMDFKNIVMTNVLFSTIVGNSVWAQESHVITDGPHTWNDGLTINNVGDWPGSGIKAEENLTATITTHGNIDTSNNFSGLFLSQGASVTFQATDPTLNFTSNANGWEGFLVEKGSVLTLSGMNVSATGNANNGLRADQGGIVNILGTPTPSARNTLTVNGNKNNDVAWNDGAGIAVQGATSSTAVSSVSIQNMNIVASENGKYGFSATDGGRIYALGDGSHTLDIIHNVTSAQNPWAYGAGMFSQGVNSTHQDLQSTMTVAGMNITVNDNDFYGIRATEGGTINIIGTHDNRLEIANNNSADKNMGSGIVADSASGNGISSIVNIQNMDVSIRDHAYQGIAALAGGIVNIVSESGKDILDVYNSRMADIQGQDAGKGIHAKEANGASGNHAVIAIKDMTIVSNDNELEGLVAADSGVIYVESTTGEHTLTANQNRQYAAQTPHDWSYGAGLLAHGVSANSPDQQASVIIKNMNVEARDNGLYGLYARDGGVISITGDGSQTLDIIGNKSTVSHTWDAGIAIEGLIAGATSPAPAAIEIKDMEVTIKDNGRYGIDVASGGQMVISSTTGNRLTVSGNQTGDSQKNAGIGIHVAGVFDGTRSRLDIIDMDVAIDGSPDAGLKAADGAQVNVISTTGTHALIANGNDNRGTEYNEGTGLFASDSTGSKNPLATLTVVGMDIEAKNNGSYGVLSEGGHIQIAGLGVQKLDVDGNGRYGLLAKDGGSLSISGMNVSGNSLDHSLVGIERNGSIHFTNSTITTENDALFYTWSDSDAQKSEYVLQNSSATANGQVLANFTAHSSMLTTRDSLLVNAIVTDVAAGATSTVSLDRSTWQMKNSSVVTHLNAKDSLLDLRDDGGHNTLTAAGNYAGTNSTLVMNTRLGDDNSLTDKLIVAGDTSGTTRVVVNNAGGSGAKTLNGIQIIEVNGKSNGEFVQAGRIVAGSYDYVLGRGNGEDSRHWYLTNTLPDGPESPTDPSGPATLRPEIGTWLANQVAVNTLFSTRLHDRLGDTQYTDLLTGEQKATSLWLRQVGGHTRFDSATGQLHTQSNRYVVQLGGDLAQWSRDGLDRWHLGMMAGYGNQQSNTESNVSHYRSRGKVTGYSVGLYGTWYANDADKTGTYVDTWAPGSWRTGTDGSAGAATQPPLYAQRYNRPTRRRALYPACR
jgi:type V secretory pathway adhesin AidA